MHARPRRPRRLHAGIPLGLTVVLAAALLVVGAPESQAAGEARATVDFTRVAARTDPFAVGVGSSTYGATPLTSAVQSQAERRLDARTVRIPVGYRNGRVSSSAAGASSVDAVALIRQYRTWGYRVIAVIGGRTNDFDVQPGDPTRIMQAIGFDGVTYTAPNEPGNQGKSLSDQVAVAAMIVREGRALRSGFRLTGPVWSYYDRSALTGFADAMGERLGGIDYHHYGMGERSLTTEQAMAATPVYGREVSTIRADLRARNLDVPVAVDELNFSWRYQDGTPGGNNRFFTAVNTVWMTSAIGHILKAGGRALPYATQNGPLGMTVQAGATNPDRRPASSPMPAYWAVANWTGAGMWPHFKDVVYESASSDPALEVFAVNNEAGGQNVLLLNKQQSGARTLSVELAGAQAGLYTAYTSNPDRPYDPPTPAGAASFDPDPTLTFTLPPMTVTVLVLQPRAAITTTPSGPTGVTAVRSADGTRATISWSPPDDPRGTVSGYTVGRDGVDSTGGGDYQTDRPAGDRSFTFTLLRRESDYTFFVRANNAAGAGTVVRVRSAGA